MVDHPTLANFLADWSEAEPARAPVVETITVIADAGRVIAGWISQGGLAGDLGQSVGENVDGDVQKALDICANDLLVERLARAPVALIASEELETAIYTSSPDAPLAVAMDPLDGSSNIDTNTSIGTIFAILPMLEGEKGSTDDHVLQPGINQLAAGYVIYGPQTALALTVGKGTQLFVLDCERGEFLLTIENVQIPVKASEFAINSSNYRHWHEPVQLYIDDCLNGSEGMRKKDFNSRWIASLVADCQRILVRGGVFLYPADDRPGYESGRLRLLYEANPIALLIERAGGYASTGWQRILEVEPTSVHQRIPLIFGSSREVERIEGYHSDPHALGERSQLFSRRGLFRV